MQLNKAISKRLLGLLAERNIMQYQLFTKSVVHKSTTMEMWLTMLTHYAIFAHRYSMMKILSPKPQINMSSLEYHSLL